MPTKPTQNLTPTPGISSNLEAALGEEMLRLRIRVEDRARQLSLERAGSIPSDGMPTEGGVIPGASVQMEDLALALDETLGKRIAVAPKTSFFDLFPPFTCLCFLLCLIFGGFGLKGSGNGFLDIAKIFAGALVGSTTATAVSTIRSQRKTH